MALIAKLQSEFQFITERVFVLAQDKNSNAEDNSDFLNLIWRLNNEHFAGREVVKALNKPDFVAESRETAYSIPMHFSRRF